MINRQLFCFWSVKINKVFFPQLWTVISRKYEFIELIRFTIETGVKGWVIGRDTKLRSDSIVNENLKQSSTKHRALEDTSNGPNWYRGMAFRITFIWQIHKTESVSKFVRRPHNVSSCYEYRYTKSCQTLSRCPEQQPALHYSYLRQ